MALKGGDGVPGYLVTPQLLDEQFGGHHTAETDEQQGKQRPPAWRTEREVVPVELRRHGPQNAQEELGLANGHG
ncbi:hypothetical protein GCM10010279_60220 [Streptomyces mutabilis]|nr:hypothetical protein GCM10010279_60220 [Streptomyces mutabilis]